MMDDGRKLALIAWLLTAVLFTSVLGLAWVVAQFLR